MKYVALFRGINVGGHNIIKMADLKKCLSDNGFQNVTTYIQSGNVVFESDSLKIDDLHERIGKLIQKRFDFLPSIMIINKNDFLVACNNNPYSNNSDDGKWVHFGFLSQVPDAVDETKLASLKKDSESYALINQVFYVHAPEGIGRSKLVAGSEKAIGVEQTYRNLKTVLKLKEMLD